MSAAPAPAQSPGPVTKPALPTADTTPAVPRGHVAWKKYLSPILIVLLALTIFEARSYKREHQGEGMIHHWLAQHHMLDWRRPKH
jgi:hypothetical protein